MSGARIRLRNGRSSISIILAALSLFLGVFGLCLGSDARSGAIEKAFPDALATAWYVVLALGALMMLLAAYKPWPTELTLGDAYCMVNRLYLERAGLFVVGWVWQSYSFAAFAIQGLAGSTAAVVATIIGVWTGVRIREQFVDLPALREWIEAEEARLEAAGT